MTDNQDNDSDMDFLSDLLNCDAGQLRAIDNVSVQNETERLSASMTEK